MNPAMYKILGITENFQASQISEETINTLLETVQFGEIKKSIKKEIPVCNNKKFRRLFL